MEDINILIVDDDSFNRLLMKAVIKNIPHTKVTEAEDGKKAMMALANNPIDLVLLDIHMPVMNGFETLQAIRKNKQFNYLPIIMVTTDPDEREKSLDLGANDLIAKPYKLDDLETMVDLYCKQIPIVISSKPEAIPKTISSNSFSPSALEGSQKEFVENLILLRGDKEKVKIIPSLAFQLAIQLGWNQKDASRVYYASMLKDVGLFTRHYKGRYDNLFTPQEQKKYHQAIYHGYNMLAREPETDFLKIAKKVILQCREHYDGTGYYEQLKGDQICKYVYVIVMAEMFYGLISPRKYRNKEQYSKREAKDIIKKAQGRKLHPTVANEMLRGFDYFVEVAERAKMGTFSLPV